MLVLTRCPGKGNQATICIGQDMEITVLAIEGEEIRFAVTTPHSCAVSPDPVPNDFVPRKGLTRPAPAGILSPP